MMIGHYLRVALAKFHKSPFTTGANILTLALGLACFIAAYGIANWWNAADAYHENADRIVAIGQSQTRAGETSTGLSSSSNANLAPVLRLDFPEIAPVARAMADTDIAVAVDANKILLNVANVDPEFLEIFDLEFVEGDPVTALARPDSIVLTQDAAVRLFGAAPALGRRVLISGESEAVVAGVIAPVRAPSFMGSRPQAPLRFDMLRTWESRFGVADQFTAGSFVGMGPRTFAVLPPEFALEDFNALLADFAERRIPAEQRAAFTFEFRAFPVREMTTHDLDNVLLSEAGIDISAVSVLIGLGALTLLVACVNYANLATAQAAGRAREIGMRKVVGASRGRIMVQTWIEAALLTAIAVLVALLALALAAPTLRIQTGVDILHFLTRDAFSLLPLVAIAAAVSLLAAAYPALALAGVRPAAAIRSERAGVGAGSLTRILVGVQFASASFLLILITVMQLQRDHLERTALAPRTDPIVILNDIMPLEVDFETLRSRLAAQPSIRSVSVVDRGPWDLNGYNAVPYSRTREAGSGAQSAYLKSVGLDYFETLQLDVLAGRGFDDGRDTPASPFAYAAAPYNVVIDDAYARRLGFQSPQAAVGAQLYLPATMSQAGQPPAPPATVIGVVENEMTRLNVEGPQGHVYAYLPRAFFGGQHPLVRISRDDVAGGVAAITAVWDEFVPSIPVNIRFFDALFEQNFRAYARVSQLFMLLAGSAFIIASVGLIGIAVHVTARRRHEIGVRKTLGASTGRVLHMLLADFSKPVIVGNLIAWPFAWMAAQTYLRSFAERTPLTPLPFLISLAITLAIAWLSVGGQAWRAASVKPALVLRAE